MFIRKTKKIDPKSGREYFLFQLVESIRTERGPRQRILLNLCADLDLNTNELKELANRIEDIVTGQQSFLTPPEKIETLARKFAPQLIHNFSQPCRVTNDTERVPDYHTIDADTIEHSKPRSVGCEHILHHVADQLKLKKALQNLGLTPSQICLALGTIYSRAISPSSERASLAWLQKQSGLGELLDFDFQRVSLDHFYKISDILLRNKDELERHIRERQKAIHNSASTLVLYDLTNTYMEGQAKANPKAKHGRSKEKRTDCPLITLGLVVDEQGFYMRSKFLPGNVSEPKTLQKAIETLSDTSDLFKPTVLLDAGIASEDNLRWLRDNRFDYIVSARQDAPSIEVVGELVEAGNSEVKVGFVCASDDEDTWLYCESPAKKATAGQMKTLFQQRFEEALKKIAAALKKPRAKKTLSTIHERVGRVKERHSRISGCYEITVLVSEDGKKAAGLEWKLLPERLEDKLSGQYYLRTNLKHKGAKQLWELYQTIRSVEDAFRFMKSSLGLRPIYHQKEKRVDGHLWITILAYCLIHNLIYQLRKHGMRDEWKTIRSFMQSRVRVSMEAKTKEGKMLHVRTTTKPEEVHTRVYESLGLDPTILRSKKTII